MLAMMDGLTYIHEHGIIHQDIKPANIYMGDEHGPILLDFGIAASPLDRSERFPRGSEGYAALEQSAVDGRIGPWTDIYGLAATLYRCVSGKIPPPASARQKALDAGEADPLIAPGELLTDTRFASIATVIGQGLYLLPQDRPMDVRQWQKTFKSLDWRRSVPGGKSIASDPREGKEWLPRVLLGVLLLVMVTIALFLLTEKSPPGAALSPTPENTESIPSATARPAVEETSRWHAALEADTTLSYRRFMQDFPASVYVAQARVQLEVLDDKTWQELNTEGTVAAFEDYLDQFPNGLHQSEAMQHIDALKKREAKQERERLAKIRQEQDAWQAAIDKRTLASLDNYIHAWPAGQHIEEAGRIHRLLKDQRDDANAFASALKAGHKGCLSGVC